MTLRDFEPYPCTAAEWPALAAGSLFVDKSPDGIALAVYGGSRDFRPVAFFVAPARPGVAKASFVRR